VAGISRLYLAFVAVFIAGATLLTGIYGLAAAILMAFDAAAILFLIAMALVMRRDSAQRLREHAERYDASRPFLLLVAALTVATVALAIVVELAAAAPHTDRQMVLAVVTLLVAWIFGNASFALHYAHVYYGGVGDSPPGGLRFPGTREPDFWDLCYFSFVIGMTFQVSDVVVRSPELRKRVAAHALAAFIFNIAAIALTVNVVGAAR